MNDRESPCREVIANLVRRREEIIRKALAYAEMLAMIEQRSDSSAEGEDDAVEDDEMGADCDDEQETHAIVKNMAKSAG